METKEITQENIGTEPIMTTAVINKKDAMCKNIFRDATVVVTGGAGSIGTRLVCTLLKDKSPKCIRVMDSSEYNLFKLRQAVHNDERVRPFLGDVRDKERVALAVKGADIVIHMAALKHIDIAHYNIGEAIKTNIIGTENVVYSCLDELSVKKVIMISSDKAVNPTGLYGVTKLIGEKLFQWASEIQTEKVFCCIRFGNVIESSGNVFEVWKMQQSKGMPVTVTSKEMKRYFWTLRECVNFLMRSVNESKNGDLFIPKMKKYNIYDMAMKKGYSIKLMAPRQDEKIDEELMTIHELKKAEDKIYYWVVNPIKPINTPS